MIQQAILRTLLILVVLKDLGYSDWQDREWEIRDTRKGRKACWGVDGVHAGGPRCWCVACPSVMMVGVVYADRTLRICYNLTH